MRITCPSCLAQYEIETALLTAEGREVQCSACSHIWFQNAVGTKAPLVTPDPVEQAPAASVAPQSAPIAEDRTETGPQDDAARPDTAPLPKSRKLDPSVADVLREEAQFEASQRQREAEGLQSQPDLGLLGGGPWPATGADTPTGEDTLPAPEASSATQSAFPDVDDISATLEPVGEARKQGDFQLPQTAQARQRSFLRGFIVPPLLAALMVGLYVAAPQLADMLPAAAPVMSAYVGLVDSAREGLQNILARF